MQLELALSESLASPPMLWEQLDPAARQAVLDRLALAIVKAVVSSQQAEESNDE
jgi:hypothetical protein